MTNAASLDLCATHRKVALAFFKVRGHEPYINKETGQPSRVSKRRSQAEMTKFRKEVLDFVRTAKEITNKSVREKFNVPAHAATRILTELVKAKKLKLSGRSGSAKYAYSGKE